MTPTEKADKIRARFVYPIHEINGNVNPNLINRCAIICVEEILGELSPMTEKSKYYVEVLNDLKNRPVWQDQSNK